MIHPQTGAPFTFLPGKVLNALIDYVLPNARDGKQKILSPCQTEKLYDLCWFTEWKHNIQMQRDVGRGGVEPALNEKIELLAQAYPDHAPTQRRAVWSDILRKKQVIRQNQQVYEIEGFRLMEKLSNNWFMPSKVTKASRITEEQQRAIEMLPWFCSWKNDGISRREVAAISKRITKIAKLQLILDHYTTRPDGTPSSRPNWNDTIPVPEITTSDGTPWVFRPATFLDDLVDNWVEGGKPGVTIGTEEKKLLQSLPWLGDWLNSVLSTRQRKRARSDALLWTSVEQEEVIS